jgi:glycosyltransferase involved in cell wall biosynthesis
LVSKNPRVSIGIPVFNGENFLKKALDSILSQTYTDFEIIISDNASTDKTQEICLKYAAKDDRIRYYRNEENIGAKENFNRLVSLSNSQYFKWAAHDDVHAPKYLEKCMNILENDPSTVLCHSRTAKIDKNGVIIGNYDDRTLYRINSKKIHERFGDLISQINSCWYIFGVMRADSLKKTPLHGAYLDADRNLLAELGLIGRIYEIPEYLFFRRDHPQSYTTTFHSTDVLVRDYKDQLSWWRGGKKRSKILLPRWKNLLEYFRSINRVPLTIHQRLLCYREIGRWLLWGDGWKMMRCDLNNMYALWRLNLISSKKSI